MVASLTRAQWAWLIAAGAMAVISGAWIFEHFGYAPCKLCLQQRYAYYAAIPLAMLSAFLARQQPRVSSLILWLVAVAVRRQRDFWCLAFGCRVGLVAGAGGLRANVAGALERRRVVAANAANQSDQLYGSGAAHCRAVAGGLERGDFPDAGTDVPFCRGQGAGCTVIAMLRRRAADRAHGRGRRACFLPRQSRQRVCGNQQFPELLPAMCPV